MGAYHLEFLDHLIRGIGNIDRPGVLQDPG
jgi:hypothetical protein